MPSLKEMEANDPNPELEEIRRSLLNTQKQLVRAKAKLEDLVEAHYKAVRDAWEVERSFPPTLRPKKDTRRKQEEVALWHLTDWQGGKKTLTYNREVMRARVLRFTAKAAHITDIQRAEHPVRECHIMFGGDMIEGVMIYPTQPYEIDATLFEQKAAVSCLLADTVRAALAAYDRVTVTGEWGNHGRMGSKRDAVPASDNHDRECYEMARIMLSNEKRLVWEDCPEDIQRVEIGNYRALLEHGDEAGRSGWTSETTFLAYLNRLKGGAYPWAFRDVYTGHRHTVGEHQLADGRGRWYLTGSTESDNRYARDGMGQNGMPMQRLHFVHPVDGRVTAIYELELDV